MLSLLNAPFSRPFYKSVVVVSSTLGSFLNKWFTRSGGSMHLRNLLVYRTRFLIGKPGDTPWNSWRGVPPGSLNPDLISDYKMSFSTPVVSGN